MESLPPECVPTLGTEGETYRRKQCFLQLPVYDFSLDACHKMTDLEKKRYAKFTSKRSENFFGVGTLKLQGSEEGIVRVQTYMYAMGRAALVAQLVKEPFSVAIVCLSPTQLEQLIFKLSCVVSF